jgi:hypothetical protein
MVLRRCTQNSRTYPPGRPPRGGDWRPLPRRGGAKRRKTSTHTTDTVALPEALRERSLPKQLGRGPSGYRGAGVQCSQRMLLHQLFWKVYFTRATVLACCQLSGRKFARRNLSFNSPQSGSLTGIRHYQSTKKALWVYQI